MLNFLLRTSNRPKGFKRMLNSIQSQNYTDYNLLVTADDDYTEQYVKSYKINPIRVNNIPRRDENHNPYNLYNNVLLDKVNDGWIMFGDDDDYLPNPNTFNRISEICTDIDTLYIFSMVDLQNGLIIPSHKSFGKNINFGDIATPNFVFHSKWKNTSRWKDVRGGDFLFVRDLINNNRGILKINFVSLITYVVDHRGMHGAKVDI
jgi:glycosyltransferase involved in cell wall biosynthesis